MRYGFVLDQTKCIGCHACTVACKSENEVPLTTFRTWVKYIEKGEFPDVRRHFAVLRCNHCDHAPCITICPTRALFRRNNGIVDFDSDACIGCKSCMQACPYDALYIDPDRNTAAKCNFCAHRVDLGLQPACVVVCPTQAILPGDLDDPGSGIAQFLAKTPTVVRKPEQGTKPKVYYAGVDPILIDPRLQRDVQPMFTDPGVAWAASAGAGGVREVYDVPHLEPWGWRVWLYLWTKSIGAGVMMVAGMFSLLGWGVPVPAPSIGLVFILLTTALLVLDLKRPERFWYLLVRPNFSSWLVWGGYILGAFAALCGAALFLPMEGSLAWASLLLGGATAGYSAFLFQQARGRVFWGSRLLALHLLAEAVVCGAAVLLIFEAIGPHGATLTPLSITLAIASPICFLMLILDVADEHRAEGEVRSACRAIQRAPSFLWIGAVSFLAAPCAVVGAETLESHLPLDVAALLILLANLEYGRLWIRAGQSVRLS